MNQYIPGEDSPENFQAANNAERGFLAVLDLEPRNVSALESLASLKYLQAQATQVLEEKLKPLDEARGWYLRLLEADPGKKEAHYSLGVIAWSAWYPSWNAARSKLGMRPDAPGPLQDAAVRADLRSRYEPALREGLEHLNKALALDPQYDDAMAYMNLLLRESADLSDSKAGYQAMIDEADAWIQKALDTRREKAEQSPQSVAVGAVSAAVPAAPPPESPTEQTSAPRRITVGGAVMRSQLTFQTQPVYPPVAKNANVQGTVRLFAVIAKDGSVETLDLESGHPLLADAAVKAVMQWKYRPTLLNGEPMEVVTTVDVDFVLDKPSGSITGGSRTAPPGPPVISRVTPKRISVACTIVQRKLIYQPRPAYPPDARRARIEGDVLLAIVIAKDGSVLKADVKSGHPMLASAAAEAVRRWKYQPTLLNGQPVEVVTTANVKFALDKSN
jgi:TonB family protein